jgi:hypothetical protein
MDFPYFLKVDKVCVDDQRFHFEPWFPPREIEHQVDRELNSVRFVLSVYPSLTCPEN